jgi:2-octaprenyl-6-methoxyphenol hydroxylase
VVNHKVDILIIGGGLTGATLLLALHNLGYSALLIEAQEFQHKINSDFDARSLALSPATQRIFSMVGVWDFLEIHATPIKLIHVSDQHFFGVSRLKGEGDNALGYVVEMHHLNLALCRQLDNKQIMAPARLTALDLEHKTARVMSEEGEMNISAQLIIAADGADSVVRQFCSLSSKTKNYDQLAIIANIGLVKHHEYRAYERFTEKGPLALLPMTDNRMSLVWAVSPNDANELMGLSDSMFLKELQMAFGYRLGRFAKMGTRFSYPLKQVLMPEQAKWPVVFVGNAAHTLHPIAGQGFNLGLRDVATLAQCIARQGLNSVMLEDYQKLRQHDQWVITQLTDSLIHIFTSRWPGIRLARNLGLVVLDNIPALKRILARYTCGFGGVIPDLACEIALNSREVK